MKVGDKVTRMLGGMPMILIVTKITEGMLICGPYQFDLKTGIEIDDALEWGPKYGRSGSFIIKETLKEPSISQGVKNEPK